MTAGSAVELTMEDDKLLIAPAGRRSYTLEELLTQVTPENLHEEIDWGASVGLEEW
jgi:antitoxin MazE